MEKFSKKKDLAFTETNKAQEQCNNVCESKLGKKIQKMHEGFVGDGMIASATKGHIVSGVVITIFGGVNVFVNCIQDYLVDSVFVFPPIVSLSITCAGILCTSAPAVDKLIWTVYSKKSKKPKVKQEVCEQEM